MSFVLKYPLAFTDTVRGVGDLEWTQLTLEPQSGRIVEFPETMKSGGRRKRGLSIVPVLGFKGANRSRPPGWRGCQSGGIFLSATIYTKSSLSEGNLGTSLRDSSPYSF